MFLNVEEAYKEIDETEPAVKRKGPISKQDYNNYKSVLPSAKTVAHYKHVQASEIECDAVIALINKTRSVKVTLYYDTRSHNSIDGEWSSLILKFSDKKKFQSIPFFLRKIEIK